MNFAEVLDQLPKLSVSQRQLLLRRVSDLDQPPLSPADEKLVDARLAAHHREPASAVPLEQMEARVRSRRSK
jgi:hypothetical protein